MANVYTTQTKVTDEIADDIKASVTAKISGWIEDESRVIDSMLPNYSTPFNDITAATPAMIEKACRYLVCDRVARKLQIVRTDENGREVDSFREEAHRILRSLLDGSAVIPASQL